MQILAEGHEHGCECHTCRPDLWLARDTDWRKLTEELGTAAIAHQHTTHELCEADRIYGEVEARFNTTAAALSAKLQELNTRIKDLEKQGTESK